MNILLQSFTLQYILFLGGYICLCSNENKTSWWRKPGRMLYSQNLGEVIIGVIISSVMFLGLYLVVPVITALATLLLSK